MKLTDRSKHRHESPQRAQRGPLRPRSSRTMIVMRSPSPSVNASSPLAHALNMRIIEVRERRPSRGIDVPDFEPQSSSNPWPPARGRRRFRSELGRAPRRSVTHRPARRAAGTPANPTPAPRTATIGVTDARPPRFRGSRPRLGPDRRGRPVRRSRGPRIVRWGRIARLADPSPRLCILSSGAGVRRARWERVAGRLRPRPGPRNASPRRLENEPQNGGTKGVAHVGGHCRLRCPPQQLELAAASQSPCMRGSGRPPR